MLHPAYEPVHRAAVATTDLVVSAGSPFNIYAGRHAERVFSTREEPAASPDWMNMEDPEPTERFISNLLLYLEEGVRIAKSHCHRGSP